MFSKARGMLNFRFRLCAPLMSFPAQMRLMSCYTVCESLCIHDCCGRGLRRVGQEGTQTQRDLLSCASQVGSMGTEGKSFYQKSSAPKCKNIPFFKWGGGGGFPPEIG